MVERATRQRLARMLPYIWRQRRGLALILLLTIVMAAASALAPWPLKILVDYALGDKPLPAVLQAPTVGLAPPTIACWLIIAAAVASLALFALNSALDAGLTWIWSAYGQRMVYDLAADLFARLQRLSLQFHNNRSVGDLLSRLLGDTWCTYSLAAALLVAPAQQLLTIVFVGSVAWTLDPLLTGVILAAAPLLAASALYFGRRLQGRSQLAREAQARLTGFVHQTFTALPLVQSFGSERRNRALFLGLARQAVSRARRSVLLNRLYQTVNGLALAVGAALVLYFGGRRALAGSLSAGSLLVFIAYAQTLREAFSGLLTTYGNLKNTEASVERVLEVLDAEETVADAPTAQPLPPPPAGHGFAVRFEQVRFGYQPDRPVLHDLSLAARPGEILALVGATGAGKSTLLSLIPRFFDPWQGQVAIDGRDVRALRLASLRAQIALVLQEPFLLPLTIAENIAYGRPDAGRAAIVAAAEAAHAAEFIERLPQGYDTVIGERGATLSGGQRQRLAIARALLKDAPILLLDEPTAALDAHTEALLLAALRRLTAGRTTLVIAHRLATIRHADRILVLDHGRIVETGRHDELLAAQGCYYHYHNLQLLEPARENIE